MDAKRLLAASIACASLSATAIATADDMPEQYFYFGGHISENWLDVGGHNDKNTSENEITLPGAQLGYRFNQDWSVQAWWERNNASPWLFNNRDVDVNIALASVRKHFSDNTLFGFEPYAGIGAGEFRTEYSGGGEYKETIGSLEGGVQTLLHPNFILDVGARPYYSFRTERWDAEIYAGLNFLIGASSSEPAPEPEPEPVQNVVKDSDGDGVPDDRDQCPGTAAGAQVDASGCELDDDGDGVVNSMDECPDTPAGALVDDKGCQEYLTKDVKETLYVEFGLNKAEVRQTSYSELERLASNMEKYPSANLQLEGYTDSTGAASYNKSLSKKRAEAVKTVLVDHFDIDASRIAATGYGEESPIADNSTRDGRAQNRRVEAIMKATTQEAQYNN